MQGESIMAQADAQVAILGTGLIGSSIGLGLHQLKDRRFQIIGADRDRTHTRLAKKMGAIDKEVGSLEEAVSESGMVIIAVPVIAARQLLEDMVRYLRPGTIVTDTCRTKADIVGWAIRRPYLHAQLQALPFYEKLGFRSEGGVFDEAGLPHVRMRFALE
jgi:prephenate dehydrogenase